MAKDKGTTLPITQLNGLMINYDNNNSTFNPPSVTLAQRETLVNIAGGNATDPIAANRVKEGTIIYNSSFAQAQIFQRGTWRTLAAFVPGSGNVVGPDSSTAGAISIFTDASGTLIGEYTANDKVITGSNLLINNTGAEGAAVASTASQVVVFRGTDGQTTIGAKNDAGEPILIGQVALKAPFLSNRKSKTKASQTLPTDITALSGIGVVDFSEGEGLGFITCEEQQFITLNIQPLTLTQNILLTDDQEDSDPSSPNYNAIVEIRSDVGGFQLPRLTQDTLDNMILNPINDLGLMAYNKDNDVNAPVFYNGETFVPLGGGGGGSGDVTSTATSTQSTQIAIFADTTGKIIKNSGITISSNVISTVGISASGNIRSGNLSLVDDDSDGAVTLACSPITNGDYTLSFPGKIGSINQALSLIDNEGTLDWIPIGDGSGNVSVDVSETVGRAIPIWSSTDSTTLTSSPLVVNVFGGSGDYNIFQLGGSLNSVRLTDSGHVENRPFILFDSNGFSTTLQASSDSSGKSWIMTLPSNPGDTNGQALVTDGNGNTFWSTNLISFGTPTHSGINIDYTNPQNPSISLEFASIMPGNTSILPAGITDATVSLTQCVQFSYPIAFQADLSAYFTVTNIGNHGYVSINSNDHIDTGTTDDDGDAPYFNIIAPQRIMAMEFDVVSSINVKNVLERGKPVTKEVYDLFKKINLVKYEYKDKIRAGIGTHYGLIAEEFHEIMPHMVHNHQDFIPNIMCKGEVTYKDQQNIIVLLNEDKQLDILIDKQIKLFTNSGEIYGTVTSNLKETINIKLDKEYPEFNQVFVYGTKENCPVVAKDRLPEISLCVAKYQDELIESLMDRCTKLEQKLGV